MKRKGLQFPGCGARRFLHCHHIRHWPLGPTDLDNLVLLCSYHHRLVHEYGWRVELGAVPGTSRWYRPDGSRYEPGPPERASPELVAV